MENEKILMIKERLTSGGWFRILFLGDSITSAEWVHPNWRGIIGYVLKKTLEDVMDEWQAPDWRLRFYNAGYDGAATSEIIQFIDDDVKLHRPDLVVFVDTDNDKYRGIDPEEHGRNLETIFDKILGFPADLVFATSVAGLNETVNDGYKKFIQAGQAAVGRFNGRIQTVDLFSKTAGLEKEKIYTFISENGNEDMGLKPGDIDYSHPNQLGNAYIAKILLKDVFGLDFNAELYIKETLAGKKYPTY